MVLTGFAHDHDHDGNASKKESKSKNGNSLSSHKYVDVTKSLVKREGA